MLSNRCVYDELSEKLRLFAVSRCPTNVMCGGRQSKMYDGTLLLNTAVDGLEEKRRHFLFFFLHAYLYIFTRRKQKKKKIVSAKLLFIYRYMCIYEIQNDRTKMSGVSECIHDNGHGRTDENTF